MEKSGNMVASLDPDETYVRVEITMMYSSRSKNKLKWSSLRGESLKINMGTPCSIDIILSKSSPRDWLMGGSS